MPEASSPRRGPEASHLAAALSAVLTAVGYFLPWVHASIAGVTFNGITIPGVSSSSDAFAEGFTKAWPILALVAAAGVVVVTLLPGLARRTLWVVLAAVALALLTLAAYLADNGKIDAMRPAAGLGFETVTHVTFSWGFFLTALLAAVTLAFSLVGLAKD